ncbi:phage tail protein [Gilliamella apicola]|uniref:Phage tail protein n=1 Tax=Gilliamella apicola TaxID=1196095 RepID=A0A556RT96_9GAMM|nr:phage tail protein [Gilliamella apicola]TSJ92122.1 phage tail protein [Gilliamella apicola]
MEIDKFEWRTMGHPKGSDSSNINEISFGDGYKQLFANGINNHSESWELTYTGNLEEVAKVRAFLNSHIIESFLWTNPYGEEKFYRVVNNSITSEFLSKNVISLSFQFVQSFSSTVSMLM